MSTAPFYNFLGSAKHPKLETVHHLLVLSLLSFAYMLIAVNMSLSRTFTAALRTSRSTLSRRNGVNPVQHVFGQDRSAIRGYATAFERNKPHVNVGKKLEPRWQCGLTSQRHNWPRRSRQGNATRPSSPYLALTIADNPHSSYNQTTSRERICQVSRIWRN